MRSQPNPSSSGIRSVHSGFTLLEVVLALGLLAYGVLGVTAGQIFATKHSKASQSNTAAMYLAEQQMEIFRIMSADDVKDLLTDVNYPDDPDNPLQPDSSSSTTFDRRWLIQTDTPEAGMITITIEVDWQDSVGNVRTASVQSLKADM